MHSPTERTRVTRSFLGRQQQRRTTDGGHTKSNQSNNDDVVYNSPVFSRAQWKSESLLYGEYDVNQQEQLQQLYDAYDEQPSAIRRTISEVPPGASYVIRQPQTVFC